MLFGEIGAGQPVHGRCRSPAHRSVRAGWPCACARRARRGNRRRWRSRRSPSGIADGCASESRASPSRCHSVFGQERHMHRGGLVRCGRARPGQRPARRGSRRCGARPHQQPPSGRRRERDRDLQLRVIAAAGALVGLRPAVVEHILAARMGLGIAGHRADQRGRPAPARAGAWAASRRAAGPMPDSSRQARKSCEDEGIVSALAAVWRRRSTWSARAPRRNYARTLARRPTARCDSSYRDDLQP